MDVIMDHLNNYDGIRTEIVGDTVIISALNSERTMFVEITIPISEVLHIQLSDLPRGEPFEINLPDANEFREAEFVIDGKTFSKVLRDANSYGCKRFFIGVFGKLRPDFEGIYFIAHSDTNKDPEVYETFKLGEYVFDLYIDPEADYVNSVYDVKYISAIADIIDLADTVRVIFGNDTPVKISTEINGYKFTWMIAPLVIGY